MAKLIVALLLSVGLANGLANFGMCATRVHCARPHESEEIETQANGGTDIIFDCYGTDVMVPSGGDAVCGGSVPTPKPTPKPTLGFGLGT